jgi:IS30 family transposase
MTDIKTKIKHNNRGRRCDHVKLREHEHILRLHAQGKKLAEIARITERSVSTVKKQLQNVRTEKASPAQKRYSQIIKLVKFLRQLTSTPEPLTQLLPVDEKHEDEIVEAILSGDGQPYKSAIHTSIHSPWWTSLYKVQLKRHLSYEQESLLNQLVALSLTPKLNYAIEIWERNAEAYRKLNMENADAKYLIAAYYGAQQAAQALYKELRMAAAAQK